MYPPPFCVEFKNTWRHPSASPCAFMACGIVKNRNKLNFTNTIYKIMAQDDLNLQTKLWQKFQHECLGFILLFSDTVSLNTKTRLSFSEVSDSTFLRNLENLCCVAPQYIVFCHVDLTLTFRHFEKSHFMLLETFV